MTVTTYECIRCPHQAGEHIFYPFTRARYAETVAVAGAVL